MVRITLFGIPSHVGKRLRRYWRQSWTTRLWQALLLIIGSVLIYGMLYSAGVAVTTVAGIVISIVLADDITAVVRNVWRRNWTEVKVNL